MVEVGFRSSGIDSSVQRQNSYFNSIYLQALYVIQNLPTNPYTCSASKLKKPEENFWVAGLNASKLFCVVCKSPDSFPQVRKTYIVIYSSYRQPYQILLNFFFLGLKLLQIYVFFSLIISGRSKTSANSTRSFTPSCIIRFGCRQSGE